MTHRFVLRTAAAVLLIFAGANLARAQGSCTSSSATSQVRSEGTVERLGTIVLTCTAVKAAITDITVMVGATLASGAVTPDNMRTFPFPVLTSTAAFGVAPVVSMSGNSVNFLFTPAAGAQTFVIVGILANVAASGLPVGGQIVASLASLTLALNPSLPPIGIVANGLATGSGFPDHSLNIFDCSPAIVTPSGAPASISGNPDPSAIAANSLKVAFVEGFARAFLTAPDEGGGLQGTRFRIQLSGVPTAIIPYAPRALRATSAAATGSVSPAGSSVVLQRVDAPNADGSGGTVLAEVPDQFDQIPVTGGIATIVYEVTSDSVTTLDTITLFIAPSVNGNPGASTIAGSFGLAPSGPPTIAPARPQFAPSTAISLSTDKLTFNEFTGATPAAQTFNITNAGAGVLNWSASFTSVNGGNWLTLSPASGVGNGSISASVTGNSLPVASYNGTITITAPDAVNSPQTLPVSLVVTPLPTLVVTPTALSFTASSGVNPNPQQLTIETLGQSAAWTATAKTSSGGGWLNLSATGGVTGSVLTVSANTAGLAAGAYQGSITVTAPTAANSPQIVNVTLTVGAPPIITGVLNNASYAKPAVLAPGTIVEVFGTSLTDGTTAYTQSSTLPTTLAGATLLVNGVAAPLFSAAPGGINAQLPIELVGATSATIQVQVQTSNGKVTSAAFTVSVVPFSPGIFTWDMNGSGPGAILHNSDFSKVCPPGRSDCPPSAAARGEVVDIFMTGLGQVNGTWLDGLPNPQASPTTTIPTVTIGGVQAQVAASGLAQGFPGLYQVNVFVPQNAPSGNAVPVVLMIGGATSNPITIAVQ